MKMHDTEKYTACGCVTLVLAGTALSGPGFVGHGILCVLHIAANTSGVAEGVPCVSSKMHEVSSYFFPQLFLRTSSELPVLSPQKTRGRIECIYFEARTSLTWQL